MMTLKFGEILLIRIQKNQVSIPLKESCLIRLTSTIQGNSIELAAEVQEITNIYILTLDSPIGDIGINALLEIYDDGQLAYSDAAFIIQPI